jgi:outer membrane protein OmpA-like peptidoglycan-associated protein
MRDRSRPIVFALATVVGLLFAAPSWAQVPAANQKPSSTQEPSSQEPRPAKADPRAKTLSALEGIEQSDALGLEAWIEGTVADQVRVGDPVDFRFDAKKPVHLTTIYLDAAGSMTILHTGGDDDLLSPGRVTSYPDPSSGKRLVAQPPLGRERVFAIATVEALPQDMFADDEGKPVTFFERPEDARHFAQRLADYLSILDEGSVDVASFHHEVVSADTPQRYATSQIVSHFTTRTRSLRRRKLDLDIQFEFNSDRLTPAARQDLDELGRALEHPAMKERRFELAGHTDDVGSAEYNMELSKRRAQSAYEYLMQRYDIAPGSVTPEGYGEERPVVEATSEEARRRNRRVVIEQLP